MPHIELVSGTECVWFESIKIETDFYCCCCVPTIIIIIIIICPRMYWVLRVAYKLFMLLHRGSNAVSVLLKTDFRYSYVFVFKVDPTVGHTTLTHSHNCPQRSERSSPPNIRTSRPTTHTHHIHVVCDLHMKFYLIKHFTTRSELKKRGNISVWAE